VSRYMSELQAIQKAGGKVSTRVPKNLLILGEREREKTKGKDDCKNQSEQRVKRYRGVETQNHSNRKFLFESSLRE